MSIRRYTTPTYHLTVENIDISFAEVYVTFKQKSITKTFSGDSIEMSYDGTNTGIDIYFSQEDTSAFTANKTAEVQVNWIINGRRNATAISVVDITRNLLEEVI